MPANPDAARAGILERIQSARSLHGSTALLIEPQISAAWEHLPRLYRRSGTLSAKEAIALLRHRLTDYDARVEECTEAEIATAIQALLARRNAQAIAVPAGFPSAWLPLSPKFLAAEQLDAAGLDTCDGVLTSATLAIAETGTLVLQGVPGQGRRAASLVPDFHLCVLRAEDVVETVPEAFDRLAPTCTLPTTFISGPSATADIEMTRIKGVHGPRFLEVLLVSSTV